MENQYPPVIAKSLEVIKRFEEKFGWFSIRVYHFPQIDALGTFLESTQRTTFYRSDHRKSDLCILTTALTTSLPSPQPGTCPSCGRNIAKLPGSSGKKTVFSGFTA